MSAIVNRKGTVIQDPPVARFLFSDTRMAWFWLLVRVWVGLQWWDAASHKISDPGWVQTGESLKKFWMNAVAIPAAPAKPAITYDWYRGFLQSLIDAQAYTWFAKLVAYGELAIAVGLIIGAFVGLAAFAGAFMNWNFIMAGSASSNGFLLGLSIFLVLAWKIAGYYGADYFLLRWLGTPWKSLQLSRESAGAPTPAK